MRKVKFEDKDVDAETMHAICVYFIAAVGLFVISVLLVALAVACWYFFTHFSLGGGNGAGGALPVSGSTSISTSASSGEPASVPGTDASVSQPAGDGGSGTPDAGGASSTPQSSGKTGVVYPFVQS